jgi:hypothetical protein
VELAAAILIVGGAMEAVLSIQVLLSVDQVGADVQPLAVAALTLGAAEVVLGVGVRMGYLWLVAVNVAAVMGFLELISGAAAGLLFGLLDVFVVLALVRERPWFQWRPDQPLTPPTASPPTR